MEPGVPDRQKLQNIYETKISDSSPNCPFHGFFFLRLRKHPFLLALRRWGRFAGRNVCDSATEIPY